MMTEQEIMDLFAKAGALLSGHFVLSSGLHSENYINKNALYTGYEIHLLCKELVGKLSASVLEATEVVLGPATGGIVLSRLAADYITKRTRKRPLSVYADILPNGNYVIRRGYDKLVAKKRVLVVDDILTTGGSVKKVLEALDLNSADVLGAAVLCNRGKVTAEMLKVPELVSLVHYDLDSWTEEECAKSGPCSKNIPVNKDVGKGADFYIRKMERDILDAANRAVQEVFGKKK